MTATRQQQLASWLYRAHCIIQPTVADVLHVLIHGGSICDKAAEVLMIDMSRRCINWLLWQDGGRHLHLLSSLARGSQNIVPNIPCWRLLNFVCMCRAMLPTTLLHGQSLAGCPTSRDLGWLGLINWAPYVHTTGFLCSYHFIWYTCSTLACMLAILAQTLVSLFDSTYISNVLASTYNTVFQHLHQILWDY